MPYMYIPECADRTYNVDSTWHVLERVRQHNDGPGAAYTRDRRPLALVYSEKYSSIAEAFGREKQVQGGSRRKRRALIEGRPQDLPGNVRLQKERLPNGAPDEMGPSPPELDVAPGAALVGGTGRGAGGGRIRSPALVE
ncbi:GIY-YIG nuclease family protein [Mycetocola sp.]|uniref:GIY-YIG nuclease family protein n=1 Tax=Mycetocola sp. TaxID=1871042 RepID=UPI003989B689